MKTHSKGSLSFAILMALLLAFTGCGSDSDNNVATNPYANPGGGQYPGGNGYNAGSAEQVLSQLLSQNQCFDGQPRLLFKGYSTTAANSNSLYGNLSPNPPQGGGAMTKLFIGFNYDTHDVIAVREIGSGSQVAFYEVEIMLCQLDRFPQGTQFQAQFISNMVLNTSVGQTIGSIDYGQVWYAYNIPPNIVGQVWVEVATPPINF